MSGIEVNGTIGSLLDFYKHEKNIYGHCPNCKEPFRLADVKLTYGKEPPRDVITQMKRQRDNLKEKLKELEEEIEEAEKEHLDAIDSLNEKFKDKLNALNDRWNDKVENAVDKRIRSRINQIREDAIAKSRASQLGKTLEKIAPMFPGFGHFPYDVRPIFDPIDFVIFDGYFHGDVTDIVFVEFKTGQSRQSSIQNSIRKAIEKKRVHFEEKRISKDTIKMLTSGRLPNTKSLIE